MQKINKRFLKKNKGLKLYRKSLMQDLNNNNPSMPLYQKEKIVLQKTLEFLKKYVDGRKDNINASKD